jgi:hypothetical protein
MKSFHVILTALALVLAGPALADKGGKNKGKDKSHESAAEHAPGRDGGGKGKPKFSGGERDQIVAYFNANPGARSELPPGLAKKGKIPPGWQKKIAPGQRIPADVWEFRVPLPHEILVKLPPPPPGVVHVRIENRVLRVVESTHEVLDDLGLPHPPTPRR